jgi:hypothetical protein
MNNPTEEQKEEAKKYLSLGDDELYALFPPFLPEYDNTVFSPAGQIEAGKKYFKSVEKELKKAVCNDFDWASKREDPSFSDTVNLVTVLADFISAYLTGIPPFAIAVLLVRKGLDSFCKEYIK